MQVIEILLSAKHVYFRNPTFQPENRSLGQSKRLFTYIADLYVTCGFCFFLGLGDEFVK